MNSGDNFCPFIGDCLELSRVSHLSFRDPSFRPLSIPRRVSVSYCLHLSSDASNISLTLETSSRPTLVGIALINQCLSDRIVFTRVPAPGANVRYTTTVQLVEQVRLGWKVRTKDAGRWEAGGDTSFIFRCVESFIMQNVSDFNGNDVL